jgi:hypothetical protein
MARDRIGGRSTPGDGIRRRGWDRRRDLGRRITRDRRREQAAVAVERRTKPDRRHEMQRRSGAERRAPITDGARYLEM